MDAAFLLTVDSIALYSSGVASIALYPITIENFKLQLNSCAYLDVAHVILLHQNSAKYLSYKILGLIIWNLQSEH